MYTNKNCGRCNSYIQNWARYLRTQKHLRNDPDQTLKPRPIKTEKRVNDVTRKDLLSQTKEYGHKGCTKLKKHQLVTVLSKTKNLFMKKEDLQKLTKSELKDFAKEHHIKLNLKKNLKTEPIERILSFQDSVRTIEAANEEPAYAVTETKSRIIKNYETTRATYNIKLNKIISVEEAINAIVDHAKNKSAYEEGDKIYIVVSNPYFNHKISREVTNVELLIDHIENILSSNEDININQCTFHVMISKIPRGKSKPSKIMNLANGIRTKRCITQIKNTDNLCCPGAIVTALTYHTDNIFGFKRNVKHIREGREIQTKLTEELCQRLGNYNEEGFTLEDIKNIEELLDIQIKVVCAENFNTIIYSGKEKETKIYLYKNRNHFDVINSMKAFLGCCYYCEKFDKPYNNKNRHRCSTSRNDLCHLCAKPQHSPVTKLDIL